MIVLASGILQVCASVSIMLVAEQCHMFIIVVMVLSHIHNHIQVLLLVRYLQKDWSDGSEMLTNYPYCSISFLWHICFVFFMKSTLKCKLSQFFQNKEFCFTIHTCFAKPKLPKELNLANVYEVFVWKIPPPLIPRVSDHLFFSFNPLKILEFQDTE